MTQTDSAKHGLTRKRQGSAGHRIFVRCRGIRLETNREGNRPAGRGTHLHLSLLHHEEGVWRCALRARARLRACVLARARACVSLRANMCAATGRGSGPRIVACKCTAAQACTGVRVRASAGVRWCSSGAGKCATVLLQACSGVDQCALVLVFKRAAAPCLHHASVRQCASAGQCSQVNTGASVD